MYVFFQWLISLGFRKFILMSLVFHIFPQDLQEHRLFGSFCLMNQISTIQQLGSESKSEFAVEQITANQNYCSSISSFISLMI